MARAGLGEKWRCLFANDFDQKKVSTYEANWGAGDIKNGDVTSLTLADLPPTLVDLAWASFPCQDLSLAGGYRGLGGERDNAPTRSGTFWPFWKLMRGLVQADRAPRTIVLENVYGCLTSHGGKDFAAIASGAGGRRVQIWSRGHQRISFCPSIAAARLFHCGSEGRDNPGFAYRARASAGVASGRAK